MSSKRKNEDLFDETDILDSSDKSGKTKQPEKFRWTFTRTLALVGIMLLTGFVIVIASSANDNTTGLIVGLAFLPGTGLLITPIIVKSAIRESSTWKDRMFKDKQRSFEASLLKEDSFYQIEDTEPYRSRLLKGVIREALLNASVLIVALISALISGVFALVDGPPSWMLLMGRAEKEYMANAFVAVLVVVVLLIPMCAYNITLSICRIRTVIRREYLVYHAVVNKVDWYEMDITGKRGKNYHFNYCKCLGIKAKEIHDTEAILAFVPDEAYLFPDDGRSY